MTHFRSGGCSSSSLQSRILILLSPYLTMSAVICTTQPLQARLEVLLHHALLQPRPQWYEPLSSLLQKALLSGLLQHLLDLSRCLKMRATSVVMKLLHHVHHKADTLSKSSNDHILPVQNTSHHLSTFILPILRLSYQRHRTSIPFALRHHLPRFVRMSPASIQTLYFRTLVQSISDHTELIH